MKNESNSRTSVDDGSSVLPSPSLHRYIARTLRVSARHLPWTVAQQIHTEHRAVQGEDLLSNHASLRIIELDDYSWRADVSADNIAAAQALGWRELHRLLRLAQTYQCEALELARDNRRLPALLNFEVFPWP